MPPIIRLSPEQVLYQTFKEKHPKIHSFLYQIVLLVVTFECAIAICRYGPERDSSPSADVPRVLLNRSPLPTGNSSTPHICVNGAREDLVDLGSALTSITPYVVLCPSTSFFVFSLITFIGGIVHFTVLHKEDIFLSMGWISTFSITLVGIDWKHILVSLQILLPINIWNLSFASAIVHAAVRLCFSKWYERIKETRRLAEEERKRKAEEERVKKLAEENEDGDVETAAGGVFEVGPDAGEETPLNGFMSHGMPIERLPKTNERVR